MIPTPPKTAWQKFVVFFNSWPGTILFVLLFLFFVAQNFIIPSGSMVRTLLVGDMLFVKKFVYGIPTPHLPWLEIPVIPGTDGHIVDGDHPERGDIVVFRYPPQPKTHYVKRCVAVGGDELFVRDKALYLHHHEGNAYIQEHFADKGYEVVELGGKLWVKNPYMQEHPGIWNDATITRESVVIPAYTLIDHANGRLLRYEGDDLLLFFLESSEQTNALQKAPESHVEYRGRTWIKNPTSITMNRQMFDEIVRTQNYDNSYTYVEFDANPQEVVFDFAPNGRPFRVPENEFFMMGDNRDHSADSRFWGTVPYALIEGTPWFIYFSVDENFVVRWERVGTTVEELEGRMRQ